MPHSRSSTAWTRSGCRIMAAGSSTASPPRSTRSRKSSRRPAGPARSTWTEACGAAPTIVKALALGARAAFVGRPIAAGLAIGGEAGALRVLELLRAELELALGLLGCTSHDQVTRAHVRRASA